MKYGSMTWKRPRGSESRPKCGVAFNGYCFGRVSKIVGTVELSFDHQTTGKDSKPEGSRTLYSLFVEARDGVKNHWYGEWLFLYSILRSPRLSYCPWGRAVDRFGALPYGWKSRPNFRPSNEAIASTTEWIQLPSLLLELFDENVLLQVVGNLGKPMKIDQTTMATIRGKFSRMRWNWSFETPYFESINNGPSIECWIRRLHLVCFSCGQYGPKSFECSKNTVDATKPLLALLRDLCRCCQ